MSTFDPINFLTEDPTDPEAAAFYLQVATNKLREIPELLSQRDSSGERGWAPVVAELSSIAAALNSAGYHGHGDRDWLLSLSRTALKLAQGNHSEAFHDLCCLAGLGPNGAHLFYPAARAAGA